MVALVGPLLPPPQQMRIAAKQTTARVRTFRRNSTIPHGRNDAYSGHSARFERSPATVAVVVTDMVAVTAFVPGVTDAGEKLQLASAGSPEQENCTGVVNPPGCGVTDMVTVAV